jgi:hypothetical protein
VQATARETHQIVNVRLGVHGSRAAEAGETIDGGGGPKSTMGCRAGQEAGPALHRELLLAPTQCNVSLLSGHGHASCMEQTSSSLGPIYAVFRTDRFRSWCEKEN